MGRCARDFPALLGYVVYSAFGRCVAVCCHEPGVGEHPDCHEDGADDEHGAPAPAVHVDESGDGHDDVDDVLDGGGD